MFLHQWCAASCSVSLEQAKPSPSPQLVPVGLAWRCGSLMRNVVAGLSGSALTFVQLFSMSLLCVRKVNAQSCLQQAGGWLAPYLSQCDFFLKVFSCHYYLPLTHRPRLV